VVIAVLLVVVGPAGLQACRPDHDHSPLYTYIFLVVSSFEVSLPYTNITASIRATCFYHLTVFHSICGKQYVTYDGPHYVVFSIFLSPSPAQLCTNIHFNMQLANRLSTFFSSIERRVTSLLEKIWGTHRLIRKDLSLR
jgi:hypothetical protein